MNAFGLGDSYLMAIHPYLQTELARYGIQYGFLENLLEVDLNQTSNANIGESTNLWRYLDAQFTGVQRADLLLIHVGLHDIKRYLNQACLVSQTVFEQNLIQVQDFATYHKKSVYWCLIPHIYDDIHNSKRQLPFERYNYDAILYNNIVKNLPLKKGFHIIDTYKKSLEFQKQDYTDHIHLTKAKAKEYADYLIQSMVQQRKG